MVRMSGRRKSVLVTGLGTIKHILSVFAQSATVRLIKAILVAVAKAASAMHWQGHFTLKVRCHRQTSATIDMVHD